MNADLIRMLREADRWLRDLDRPCEGFGSSVCSQAADALEAAEARAWRAEADAEASRDIAEKCRKDAEAAEAEVERLREAVHELEETVNELEAEMQRRAALHPARRDAAEQKTPPE